MRTGPAQSVMPAPHAAPSPAPAVASGPWAIAQNVSAYLHVLRRINAAVAVRHRAERAAPTSADSPPAAGVAQDLGMDWDAVDDRLDALAERGRLRTALDGLAHSDRELVLLVAWEGLTPAEAAAALGISQVAARSRLHRAPEVRWVRVPAELHLQPGRWRPGQVRRHWQRRAATLTHILAMLNMNGPR